MSATTVAIKHELTRLLTPLGFSRRGSRWVCWRGNLAQVIDLQLSKAAHAVTVNVGVLDRDVYEIVNETSAPDWPDAPECTLTRRIGDLTADRRDLWWDIEADTTASAIATAVEHTALPFLRAHSSRPSLLAALDDSGAGTNRYPFPALHLAVLHAASGDVSRGRALLEERLAELSGPWHERVESLLARLPSAGI